MAEQLKQYVREINPIKEILHDVSNKITTIENSTSGTMIRINALEKEVQDINDKMQVLKRKFTRKSWST